MEQLPLFAEDKLHTFKPLAEGGINSLQFFNDSLLSTTSRYYVDIFSFTLPAGHWYLQISSWAQIKSKKKFATSFVTNITRIFPFDSLEEELDYLAQNVRLVEFYTVL